MWGGVRRGMLGKNTLSSCSTPRPECWVDCGKARTMSHTGLLLSMLKVYLFTCDTKIDISQQMLGSNHLDDLIN